MFVIVPFSLSSTHPLCVRVEKQKHSGTKGIQNYKG